MPVGKEMKSRHNRRKHEAYELKENFMQEERSRRQSKIMQLCNNSTLRVKKDRGDNCI